MQRATKQFDPGDQFDQLLNEIDATLNETAAKFDRLIWLRKKIAEQFDAARQAAERLELFTEEEAAEILRTEPRMLADLRRKFDLPFCRLGRDVRYTRSQLTEICGLLEINGKRRKALQTTPLKQAA
ncbi:MAG: helix-turn-helix domain-containing protein [Pyrinomonadaceae bacterium]|jgi:hypothetical protein|nr:helix-turn-helix domain-containing protein [Pyrinomonadaceae bacterium]